MPSFKNRRAFLQHFSLLAPGIIFFKDHLHLLSIPRIGFFTGEGYPQLGSSIYGRTGKAWFQGRSKHQY